MSDDRRWSHRRVSPNLVNFPGKKRSELSFLLIYMTPTESRFLTAHQHKTGYWRRDAVLINRLRIGHTRLTHSYLLSGDDQPVCSACQSPLTVKHLLIECVNFAATCSRYFRASSMKDVFENVDAQSVIDFIKEIIFLSRVVNCNLFISFYKY